MYNISGCTARMTDVTSFHEQLNWVSDSITYNLYPDIRKKALIFRAASAIFCGGEADHMLR